MLKMNDEIDEKLNEVCMPTDVFNNKKIEKAIYHNALLIDKNNIENIHTKILKILDINSEKKSKYFNFATFKSLYATAKLSKEPRLNLKITELDLI
jgi:hypothetical protein